ncbi:MAG: flagellar export chaperone FliS [Cellulosilyticum sp.]|nr:flagellar export chaperone FliS [Cellulosilyticum sp.]
MLANQYQKYQQNSVLTASPAELTLMLYNGAIKFCNLAIEAIENNQVQQAHNYSLKAQQIILELKVTLDPNFSEAQSMNSLYDYIMDLLAKGNMKKDKEMILEAKGFIVEFRDLWHQIMKKGR